jgi:hypothetical protein
MSDLDARIFSPSSLPFGKGYEEWSAEWWQWAFSIPAAYNPLLDETGEKCVTAQHGPTWFLAGMLSSSGRTTRHCAVPEGTALFFPIAVEWANVEVPSPLAVEPLRDLATPRLDDMTDLRVEVDGTPIQGFALLRFTSPVFSVTLPPNNVLQALGKRESVPGTYFPVVAEGFYVLLRPLAVGAHTLRIHTEVPSLAVVRDVTYQLTVVPLVVP